jgi:hypothetical protein
VNLIMVEHDDVLLDESLSWTAKGLLVFVLACGATAEQPMTREQLYRGGTERQEEIDAALEELRRRGLLLAEVE